MDSHNLKTKEQRETADKWLSILYWYKYTDRTYSVKCFKDLRFKLPIEIWDMIYDYIRISTLEDFYAKRRAINLKICSLDKQISLTDIRYNLVYKLNFLQYKYGKEITVEEGAKLRNDELNQCHLIMLRDRLELCQARYLLNSITHKIEWSSKGRLLKLKGSPWLIK